MPKARSTTDRAVNARSLCKLLSVKAVSFNNTLGCQDIALFHANLHVAMGKMQEVSTQANRVLLTSEKIQTRVRELAAEIDRDYPDGPLYLVSILKGAFIFMADLARALPRHNVRIEFMGISSYGNAKTSSGQVKVTRDLDVNIEGQHVLIVEDIIDSGVTLSYLTRVLHQRKPKSLNIVTLLDKPDRRIQPVDVKYVGFQIPDEFVVGYGLDFAEDYRNLSDICILAQ